MANIAPILLIFGFILLFGLASTEQDVQPADVVPEFKNLSLSHISGICGNEICESNEDHFSCPKDCVEDIVNLEKIFCEPIFKCGSWLESPFMTFILLAVTFFGIAFFIKKNKTKRL